MIYVRVHEWQEIGTGVWINTMKADGQFVWRCVENKQDVELDDNHHNSTVVSSNEIRSGANRG
jgi:hypothetical protein